MVCTSIHQISLTACACLAHLMVVFGDVQNGCHLVVALVVLMFCASSLWFGNGPLCLCLVFWCCFLGD